MQLFEDRIRGGGPLEGLAVGLRPRRDSALWARLLTPDMRKSALKEMHSAAYVIVSRDSFAGIAPSSMPNFLAAELLEAAVAADRS